ncbi:hypothetical protein D3273_10915 [Lichenibacterium minor]|uniref:DUF2938 family protein n=1 Tax=Lichenibacterium minor TaxID=2316528 RepID=A0A4Q2U6D5_9HYPH|nr:hypothetical protein [Lichenibacterium minor]RYC31932.1 hypothetical protein D3273_10915 [Lichenibacterium minor]
MSRDRTAGLGTAVLVTGTVAGLLSAVGLAMAAEAEGKAPLRPLNATSHWLNGDFAGLDEGLNPRRTGVGFATNHAACLFWALPFTAWQRLHPAETAGALVRDGLVMAAIAAAVDYGATPKRFTPGWELVLSKAGMAGAYAALAVGFAAGASLDRRRLRP